MKNFMKVEFSATVENVTFARGVISSFLVNNDLTINTMNEIMHGYGNNPNKLVEMEVEIEDNKLVIIIRDDGIGIADVEKAREPLYTTKLKEERAGLGFTIMDIFSDELDVISAPNEGTTVICTKYLENGQ
jgi:stage II sporulation protein AB (anti-sigma F factor)